MADVVDHFAALGLERAAHVDEAAVRERFHELSRELHPDADGGDEEKFAAINEAQRVLSSTASRLRHLLELEFGERAEATGQMSEALMTLFGEIGGVLQTADELVERRRAATTAVARALLAGDEMSVQSDLMTAGGKVQARRAEIEAELADASPDDRESLEAALHELAFLEKWQGQIQERMGALL